MSPRAGPTPEPAQSGQALVELLAALPVLLLAGVVAFHLLAAGYAGSLAGDAAEAGAIALAGGRDPVPAARRAVPEWSRMRLEVTSRHGRVSVRVSPPGPIGALTPALEGRASAAVGAP